MTAKQAKRAKQRAILEENLLEVAKDQGSHL